MLSDYQGVISASNIPAGGNVSAFYPGDVLLSNIRPYLKKVWQANFIGGCSTDVMVIKAKKYVFDKFLYYIIANDSFINYAMSGAKGVKMPRGDKEQLMKYELATPSIDEQKKIASLLTLIDQRIALQNKIIERFESLIKAITKSLVTNGTKLIQLQDIADIYQPQTITASLLSVDGKYPVYGANGIIGKYNQYNHANPQICLTCRGNTCGTINYSLPYSWITGNSMVINVDRYPDRANKRYLYHLLSAIDFTPYISGSGQPQIVRNSIEKMPIYLPDTPHQTKVASALDAMIEKRETEKSILRLLAQRKKEMLRRMFI